VQIHLKDSTPLEETEVKSYNAILFYGNPNEVIDFQEKAIIKRYSESGGFIIGHDLKPINEYTSRWYMDLIDTIYNDNHSISYLLEQLPHLPLPKYQKARTPLVPEENRFSKQVLDFNLDEPMELDEIPGKGILFVERRGAIKFYDFQSQTTKILDTLAVAYKNEDGLLGLAIDPHFADNQWIYLFYSPPTDEPIQRISRFTLKADNTSLTDEHILLEFPLIRQCCHSGGALQFGPDGLLYIGTGDNTNPFESNGFAPIDERPGRTLWDAQKSAANANDLRGKILRIKPEPNGTYSIPEGNLFPEGTPLTRPEIYVMGCRNPFRLDLDPLTGYLYWGDVGPDSGQSDSTRGPKGMGEFNQARTAGFWGWPYTRGNNQPYRDYDFSKKSSGPAFDPQHIINNSPNNTGIQELPPVQSSFIWYSYDTSEEFPWLNKGGVNPMGGPVFRKKVHGNHFPDYFEGKLFVYEWMRDWIYVVAMDENGDYIQADPFMPNTEFSHPMDMIFGTDGHLYLLEYGQKWNAKNLDARLSRIDYNPGNRTPTAKITASTVVGATPLTVDFSGQSSMDFDGDPLQFSWNIPELDFQSKGMDLQYTFEKPGHYLVELTAKDAEGNQHQTVQKITAGNEPPQLHIITQSQDFVYWKERKIDYEVVVQDLEDGTTHGKGEIDPQEVSVSLTYLPQGKDPILASLGHQNNEISTGEQLINASDCKACHAIQEKVNGPSYQDIAGRYGAEDKNYLISKIIKGGSGVWGETMMSAHPQLSIQETESIVDYILSLDPDEQPMSKILPLNGTLEFDLHPEEDQPGQYILQAYYLDKGHPDVAESSLSASQQIFFTAPLIEAEDASFLAEGIGPWGSLGATLIGSVTNGKYLGFEPIGFENLTSIKFNGGYNGNYRYGGKVELRKDAIDGPLLGSQELGYYHPEKGVLQSYDIPIKKTTGVGSLYLVFRNANDHDQYVVNPNWILLNYQRK